MRQMNKSIQRKPASHERGYVKVYYDFLDNSFLTAEEQMIFIVLKSYIDFGNDSGETCQSLETICKRTKMSRRRVIDNIKSLVEKGVIRKIRRGLTQTNLYTLSDCAAMWD